MIALRVLAGLSTGAAIVGFVLLALLAASLRRSFGASPTSPLLVGAILAALLLLMAGVVFVEHRAVLHAGAVAAVVMLAGCALELTTLSLAGAGCCLVWLAFYGCAVWRSA